VLGKQPPGVVINDAMKFFARHSIRRYAAVAFISAVCTVAVVNFSTLLAVEQPVVAVQQVPDRPHLLPTSSLPSAPEDVTERARDWRRTNRVALEYNTEIAHRLKKLSELRTPANHPDTVRLARDLLDPPPDNADKIKHSRYIMKTPQAEKVDEITKKMVRFPS